MSWRDVGFLVLGLVLGSNFGLLIYALCHAARRGDEMMMRPETGDGERRVVFERKVMISKRCAAPRAPKGKPTVPAPPPPPGPEKAVNE